HRGRKSVPMSWCGSRRGACTCSSNAVRRRPRHSSTFRGCGALGGERPSAALVHVPGVLGPWWGGPVPLDVPYATADNAGLQFTYCFLDDDPVATAERLRPALDARWAGDAVAPRLAAPFHT